MHGCLGRRITKIVVATWVAVWTASVHANAEPPVVTPSAQAFTDSLTVSLSSEEPGATIYYTVDGSVPSKAKGTLYEAPFPIAKTTLVSALVISSEGKSSALATTSYLHVSKDVAGHRSSLPIMVIDTLAAGPIPGKGWSQTGAGITQVPRQPAVWMLFNKEESGHASVHNAPQLATRIGIRQRGSFSSTWKEKPYSLEAWDGEAEEAKVSPLGMPKHADWVLYYPDPGQKKDRTLLYNTFMWSLSAKAGRYAPRFRWVETYVNEDGGPLELSDRRGLYAIVEKVSRGKKRLVFDKLSDNGKTGGWQLSINRMDAVYHGGWPAPNGVSAPQYFHTAGPNRQSETPANQRGRGDDFPQLSRANFNFESPNGYKITPIQRIAIESWLHQFEDALYDDARWLDPKKGYQKFIDPLDFIDFFIFNNLAQNYDGLLLSIYPWRSSDDGLLRMGPTWDFNYGCYNQGRPYNGSAMNQRSSLWYGRLFDDPAFLQRYAERWQELRKGVLSNASMSEVIAEQTKQIGETTAVYQGISSAAQWKQRIHSMETWLHQRADWLDSQFPQPPAINVKDGASVSPNTQVRLSVAQGTVYYTTDGSDPKGGGATIIHRPNAFPLLSMKAPARAFVPTTASVDKTWFKADFDDSQWQLGTTGVGYDEEGTYRRLLGIDFGEQLAGKRTSAYVRIPFEISQDPTSFVSLSLKIAYDDGYVAYLNGTRVAADRAPASLAWDSRATSKNSDQLAFDPLIVDLSQQLPLLRQGTNLLAIHGLNDQPSSSDMLVAPSLFVGIPREGQADGPLITEETIVIARTFLNDLWSAPIRAKIAIKP